METLKQKNLPTICCAVVGAIGILFFVLILASVVIPSNLIHINFTYPVAEFLSLNWLWFIISLVVVFAFILFAKYFPRQHLQWTNKVKLKHILLTSVVVLIIQLLIVLSNFFIAGWDVHAMFFKEPNLNEYFSHYPNNLFLRGLFDFGRSCIIEPFVYGFLATLPMFKPIIQAVSSETLNYALFVFVNCLCSLAASIMLYFIAETLLGKTKAFFVWIFSIFFIAIISWNLVPYSDVYSLFFVCLILFERVKSSKVSTYYMVALPTSVIACSIKPTVLFLIVAFAIWDIICGIKFLVKDKSNAKKVRQNIKAIVIKIAVCVLACFVALGITTAVKSCAQVSIDPNQEYSAWHFAMLGLNTKTDGTLNEDEFNISASAKDCQKRTELNQSVIIQRVEELGPGGVLLLYAKKMVGTFTDGSFAWHLDGGANFSQKSLSFKTILTGIYDKFKPINQIVWYLILLGIGFTALIAFRVNRAGVVKSSNNMDYGFIFALSLALFFLVGFLTVFECGARYVVCYLPVFLLLSAFGWSTLVQQFIVCNKKTH